MTARALDLRPASARSAGAPVAGARGGGAEGADPDAGQGAEPGFASDPGLALDLAAAPGPDGRTRLVRRRVTYPWSLGRAFPGPDPAAPLLVLPQAAAAGLLAGDEVRHRLDLAPGARVRLASAGATVVHAPGALSPAQGPAAAAWRFRLDEGAELIVAAEPHVLLPRARLALETEVELAASARLVAFEGVCLADPAAPAAWRTRLVVRRPGGALLFEDRQHASAEALGRLRRLPHAPAAFGTLVALAPAAAGILRAFPPGPLELPNAYAACAPLRAGAGVAIRIACADGGALREAGAALVARACEAPS